MNTKDILHIIDIEILAWDKVLQATDDHPITTAVDRTMAAGAIKALSALKVAFQETEEKRA